jgi:hypothetical protein
MLSREILRADSVRCVAGVSLFGRTGRELGGYAGFGVSGGLSRGCLTCVGADRER